MLLQQVCPEVCHAPGLSVPFVRPFSSFVSTMFVQDLGFTISICKTRVQAVKTSAVVSTCLLLAFWHLCEHNVPANLGLHKVHVQDMR